LTLSLLPYLILTSNKATHSKHPPLPKSPQKCVKKSNNPTIKEPESNKTPNLTNSSINFSYSSHVLLPINFTTFGNSLPSHGYSVSFFFLRALSCSLHLLSSYEAIFVGARFPFYRLSHLIIFLCLSNLMIYLALLIKISQSVLVIFFLRMSHVH
jgi:hypothetical protein